MCIKYNICYDLKDKEDEMIFINFVCFRTLKLS